MPASTAPAADPAPLMLSVSGLRGLVGRSLTPSVAAEFAAAWGSTIRAGRPAGETPTVVLGRDSRPSGPLFADAARAGLASVGCRVIDLGIVATPTAGIMVVETGAAAGLVVTASHNPIEWNGLKCLDARGVAPSKEAAEAVIARFREGRLDFAMVDELAEGGSDDRGHGLHVERVLPLVDVDAIRAAGITVVLDSVCGAGGPAGRMLLDALGCTVVHLGAEPTGHFPHSPEPLKENLVGLSEAVREHGAAVGFAQDPDADRLAIVDGDGAYIGEEYTLVLATKRMLERRGGGVMAANLSTSRMIDDVAAAAGAGPVIRSAVGEANVADAMMRAADAGDGEPLVGGEGNGGVIVPAVGWVRDSLSAMALVLDAMAAGPSVAEMVASVPAYAIVKDKLDLAAVGGRDAIPGILDGVRGLWPDGRIDDADGVRVDVGRTWVHVRPSNTEPILRIIAEAPEAAEARDLVARVRELLPA